MEKNQPLPSGVEIFPIRVYHRRTPLQFVGGHGHHRFSLWRSYYSCSFTIRAILK